MAQGQTYRSMEEKRNTKNKHVPPWSINFQQRLQSNSMGKRIIFSQGVFEVDIHLEKS